MTFAIIYLEEYIIANVMPTLAVCMKKSELFQHLGIKTQEDRKKTEFSAEEMAIYELGKSDAYKAVLEEMSRYWSTDRKKSKKIHKNAEVFGKMAFSAYDLFEYVSAEIGNLNERLRKARKIYVVQAAQIRDLTQLKID